MNLFYLKLLLIFRKKQLSVKMKSTGKKTVNVASCNQFLVVHKSNSHTYHTKEYIYLFYIHTYVIQSL